VDSSLTHRFVDVNGVRLHIAEQGQGPLVLLLHGWPESWYSWRHQFGALAAAGYQVVALTSAATPAASSRRTSPPTRCSTSSVT
jgi:alpha-beta hydrolase superfamily lysophospholipase